jgi:hypothetical protein
LRVGELASDGEEELGSAPLQVREGGHREALECKALGMMEVVVRRLKVCLTRFGRWEMRRRRGTREESEMMERSKGRPRRLR